MERAVFEIILEQRAEVQKVGRNFVTSQRRDVGSTRMEVNKWQTLRCPNVATSVRILHQTSLKAHGPEIEGESKYVRTRARKESDNEPDQGRRQLLFLVFFFPERLLMFYRLILCITEFSMF